MGTSTILIITISLIGLICAAILRFKPKLEIVKFGVMLSLIFLFAKSFTNFNKFREIGDNEIPNQLIMDTMIENQLILGFLSIFILAAFTEIYRSKKD